VSFAAPKDAADLDVLNRQPTSFLLPAQAVDQLRAAAGTIISVPPDFQRLLKEAGVKIVPDAARP
jgi:NTE family protein